MDSWWFVALEGEETVWTREGCLSRPIQFSERNKSSLPWSKESLRREPQNLAEENCLCSGWRFHLKAGLAVLICDECRSLFNESATQTALLSNVTRHRFHLSAARAVYSGAHPFIMLSELVFRRYERDTVEPRYMETVRRVGHYPSPHNWSRSQTEISRNAVSAPPRYGQWHLQFRPNQVE